jgi:hypothetical protein
LYFFFTGKRRLLGYIEFWIGVNDLDVEGIYENIDGTEVDWTNIKQITTPGNSE